MASSPVTGERPSGFRRSSNQFASLPQRGLSFHERVAQEDDDAAADVLYTHPNVRIYTFQPPTDALDSLGKTKKTLPDADYPIDAIEILPWRSRTESLSAKGKLVVEKVKGSAHFIKSGILVYSILRNSQCWCVDGQSKFVMRIGRLRYLRMEFPASDEQEKRRVEEFKEVIAKIMKYEKTPCPFIRAFRVDLPDDAITPRRKGTWKRKESATPTTPDGVSPFGPMLKSSRTMSLRGMPPTSFPSRSTTIVEPDRPRTASTPIYSDRFSFGEGRSESPTMYAAGEDAIDSDRTESSHPSEAEDSDREKRAVPLIRSPLNHVQNMPSPLTRRVSASSERPQRPSVTFGRRSSTVGDQIKAFERFQIEPETPPVRRAESRTRAPVDQNDPSPRTTSEIIASAPVPTKVLANIDTGVSSSEKDAKSHSCHAEAQQNLELATESDTMSFPRAKVGENHANEARQTLEPASESDTTGFQRAKEHHVNNTRQTPEPAVESETGNLQQEVNIDKHTHEVHQQAEPPAATDIGTLQREIDGNSSTQKLQHEEEPLTDNDSLFRTLVEECKSPRPGGSDSGYSEPSSDEPPPDYGTKPDPEHSKAISAALARHLTKKLAQSNSAINESSSTVATASERKSEDLVATSNKTLDRSDVNDHENLLDGQSTFATAEDSSEDPETKQEPDGLLDIDESNLVRMHSNDDARSTISTDSFHTLLSDDESDTRLGRLSESLHTRPFQHRRELSEMTVTAASMGYESDATRGADSPSRPSLPSLETSALPTTPGAFTEDTGSELRQRLRHRRSLSPLPPSAVLRPASPTGQASPISAALLQKAATLAVVKPIEVAMLIVHVLVRIAGGATVSDLMSGELFRRPNGPRRTASGTFERNVQIKKPRGRSRPTPSEHDISEDEYEDEDDFGHPVHNRRKSSDSLD